MAKVKEGKQGNVWIVKGGDNVAKIARDVYGNERMMAEIMRLNGGVKTLRPGMVLRLPAAKKNSDIFISNDWAANMGMATNDQVAQWYDQNPNAGGMTASWNAAGGGWKNSIAGGGPGLNPGIQNGALVPNPSGPSNAWGNNLDALGAMQGGTVSNANATNPANPTNPYGSNADAIAAMRANAARSTNANRPAVYAQTGNTNWENFDPNIAGVAGTRRDPMLVSMRNFFANRTNDVPSQVDFSGLNTNRYANQNSQMRSRSSAITPSISNSPAPTPYWQLAPRNPYGAPVNGAQLDPNLYGPNGFFKNAVPQRPTPPPITASGVFGAVKNTFLGNPTPPPVAAPTMPQTPQTAAQWEVTAKQKFGITGAMKIVPTAYNQDLANVEKLAPFVQQAVNAYAYSSKLPPGSPGATFTLDQAKILEQAGVIQPGTDNYKQIMEYLNQNTPAPTTDTPTTNTNGSWDVWNLGGTQKPVWMEQQYKRGGGRLSDYSGYIRSSYGPSLGLKNWRGIE